MNEQCWRCDNLRSENKFKAWVSGILAVLLLTSIASCMAVSVQANNAKMDLAQANDQIAELKAATAENLGAATLPPDGSYRVEACSLHRRACIMTPLGAGNRVEEPIRRARFYSLAYIPGGLTTGQIVAVLDGKVVATMNPLR